MNAIRPAKFPSGSVLIISTTLFAVGLWNGIGRPQSGNLDVGPYQNGLLSGSPFIIDANQTSNVIINYSPAATGNQNASVTVKEGSRNYTLPVSLSDVGSASKTNLLSSGSNADTLNVDPLPFDTSCPFIWENDSQIDVFDLELVMALANNGVINLVGLCQSPQPYQTNCEDLQAIVNLARQIGWVHIPDATVLGSYYRTALTHPADDFIDSTVPVDTACSEMITNKVLTLGAASKPLVIAMGGCMTTVASAYLLANQAGRGAEFASKCVLIADIGEGSGGSVDANTLTTYNDIQDEWALYICLQRLRVVIENGEGRDELPNIWTWIANTNALPENVLTDYMRSKQGSNYPYYNIGWGVPPVPTPNDLNTLMIFLYPATGSYFKKISPVSYLGMGNWPTGFFTLPDADDAYDPGLQQNLGNYNAYETNVEIQTDLNSTNTVCISSMNGTSAGSPLATYVYTNALTLALSGYPRNSNAPILTIQQINPTTIKVLWPSSFTGWTLWQNTNMAKTNWSINSSPVSDDTTNKSINNSLSDDQILFRLRNH